MWSQDLLMSSKNGALRFNGGADRFFFLSNSRQNYNGQSWQQIAAPDADVLLKVQSSVETPPNHSCTVSTILKYGFHFAKKEKRHGNPGTDLLTQSASC